MKFSHDRIKISESVLKFKMEPTYADSMIILSTILFVWLSFLLTYTVHSFFPLFLRKGLRLKHEFLGLKTQ